MKKIKKKREHRDKHQFKRKAGWTDKHHIFNASRGGKYNKKPYNMLLMDAYRHDALHLLFGNKTLEEIIEFLQRLLSAKNSQRLNVNE